MFWGQRAAGAKIFEIFDENSLILLRKSSKIMSNPQNFLGAFGAEVLTTWSESVEKKYMFLRCSIFAEMKIFSSVTGQTEIKIEIPKQRVPKTDRVFPRSPLLRERVPKTAFSRIFLNGTDA